MKHSYIESSLKYLIFIFKGLLTSTSKHTLTKIPLDTSSKVGSNLIRRPMGLIISERIYHSTSQEVGEEDGSKEGQIGDSLSQDQS